MSANAEDRVDDAEVMRLWRQCGLPEYFLGNGGTNTKLVAFATAVSISERQRREEADELLRLWVQYEEVDEATIAYFRKYEPGK